MQADRQRGLKRAQGWRLVMGLAMTLGLLLPAQAGAASWPFEPGHYVGHTDQTCTKAAAEQSACKVGERLPISFTLTRNQVSHVKAVVIDKCEGEIKTFVWEMNYPHSFGFQVTRDTKRPLFFALNSIIKHSVSLTNDRVFGYVKGVSAQGRLQSLLQIDAHGHLDPEGNWCQVGSARWHAKLKRSPRSSRARRATLSSLPSSQPLSARAGSKPVFAPGHYVGHTNQTCTAKAAAWGDCEAHKLLPISFTVSRNFISHVNAIAITKCSGNHPEYVHVLHYPKPSLIFNDPAKSFFFDLQSIIKQQMAATNDLVAGYLKGEKAVGGLESFVILDSTGNLDPLGTTGCNSGQVRWKAKRVG